MKYTIVFTENILNENKEYLIQNEKEQMTSILCGISKSENQIRFLAREINKAGPEGLEYNSEFEACAKKEFRKKILIKCLKEGFSLIDCHSHPLSNGEVNFSSIDDENDQRNLPYISEKIPGWSGSMVFGKNGFKARIYKKEEKNIIPVDEIVIIGNTIKKFSYNVQKFDNHEIFDRQILLFGYEGQQKLSEIIVAIIGLGGIGSIVFEMLTRLGVGKIILVDDDVIETSNLNRLIGSTPHDGDNPKVEVLKEHARKYSKTQVEAINKNILDPSVIDLLKEAEVIFLCTDTQSSTMILNEFSVKYLVPLIDLKTGIITEKGFIEAGGQVRIVLPDSFCLACIDGIDFVRVGEELLGEDDKEIRRNAGYTQGYNIPSPSVISLNGVIASLGVTEFINLVCGIRPVNTYINYDMQSNNIISQVLYAKKDEECLICRKNGIKALGDLKSFKNLLEDKISTNIPFVSSS